MAKSHPGKTSDLFVCLEEHMKAQFSRRPGSRQHRSVGELVDLDEEYSLMNYEIHEDANGNVFVRGLTVTPILSADDAMGMISNGLGMRATHETKMNPVSSRSHTVFTVFSLINSLFI